MADENPFAQFVTPSAQPPAPDASAGDANPFQQFVTPSLHQDAAPPDGQMTGWLRQPSLFASAAAKGLTGAVGGLADQAVRGAGMMGATETGMPQEDFPSAGISDAALAAARNVGAVDRSDLQPQGPGEKLVSAAGEGAGAALPFAALGGLPGLAWGAATGAAGGAAGELTPDAVPGHPELGRAAGNLVGGLSFFGLLKLLGHGLTPLAEGAARTFLPGAVERQAADRATKAITSDMGAGGPGPDEIAAGLADANGKPLTIADLSGENTRALLGKVYRSPGEQRQAIKQQLETRDADAGPRLISDTESAISPGDFVSADDLITGQRVAAAPAYAKAHANPTWSPRLQEFLDDPVMKQGLNQGMKMERLDALAEGRPFDPTSMGVDIDPLTGDVKILATPNMRVLDAGKRGLDQMVGAARDSITGKLSPEGRSVNNVLKAYVGELDKLNPDYATARAAFAGPARSLDALRQGEAAFTMAPSEIAQTLGDLPAAEQSLFRQGAQTALARRIAQTPAGSSEAERIIGNSDMQQQLLALSKDLPSYEGLIKGAQAERRMFQLKRDTIGGSDTARRVAEDATANGHGSGGLAALAGNALLHGEPGTGLTLMGMRYLGQVLGKSSSASPAVNAATAKLLMSQDPEVFGGLVQQMKNPTLLTGPRVGAPAGLLGALIR